MTNGGGNAQGAVHRWHGGSCLGTVPPLLVLPIEWRGNYKHGCAKSWKVHKNRNALFRHRPRTLKVFLGRGNCPSLNPTPTGE